MKNLEFVPAAETIDKAREAYIENMLVGASDLRELYGLVATLTKYEDQANEKAMSFADLSVFFQGELAKLAMIIDSINGHQTDSLPTDPVGLDEVIAAYPSTPLGEVTERYGLRAKTEELLMALKVKQEGVDVEL